jgi:SprT protein
MTLAIKYQDLVLTRVNECLSIATNKLAMDFAMPNILFKQRGKIAGCARLQSNQLRFNPVLLADNLDAFLEEVIPHEICHLLVFRLYGKVRPHGKEWKSLMSQLYGLTGNTYHKLDVSKVMGNTFNYRCLCGPLELSIRRHNKVLRRKVVYTCMRCGQKLQSANSLSPN